MNPTRILFLVPLLLPLAACAEPTGPSGGPPPEITALPRALSGAEEAVLQAGNSFAVELLGRVVATSPGSSAFLSPLSASMALGMAAAGAEGETFEQMRRTLGFGELAREEMGDAYRGLLDLLRGLDPAVEIEIGNALWVREGFPVETSFLEFVRTSFDAGARTLDFDDPGAAGVINAWAAERTRGRVPSIVDPPIDPLTMLFLTNAIYFKGDWRERFDSSRTQAAPFHGVRTTASVRLMRQEGTFRYREEGGVQVVDLPYGGDAFVLTLLLPPEGGSVGALLETLAGDGWDRAVSGMAPREGEVYLPRFRMEYRRALREDLVALGMEDAFDPSRADFRGIARDARELGLHVSRVLQKTFVEVNEEGTEAAAVTSVEVGVTSLPQRFTVRADRPFLVAIRERISGTILFLGAIVEPPAG